MLTEGVIIALIALLASAGGTVATNHFMRPKIKADAYKSSSEAFEISSRALQERIETVEEENKELRTEVETVKTENKSLKIQIEKQNIVIQEQAVTIERQAGHIRLLEQKLNKAGLAMK